jgi:hypothetical protein
MLMRRRITMVAAVMAACLAMPAMPAGAAQPSTGGTTLATVVSAPSASIVAATRKPRASLSVTLGQSATGRPQVRATSNAKKVRVAYRIAKGTKRAVTKKLRKSRATITLPTGARSIRVRAKATARLAASPWVVAAIPVIVPVVAPPAPIVAPLLPPPPPTPIGYDVSWPQCGATLPGDAAFAVVGVNGGLANNANPCLGAQLAWASGSSGVTSQPRVALYVNTANPSATVASWWPSSDVYPAGATAISNPYGTCSGGDSAACSYIYGYAKAYDNGTRGDVPDPASFFWWLDVETENSWGPDRAANRAVLEGMTHYYLDVLHAAGVGIYSTGYQWGVIVGAPGAAQSGTAIPGPSNLNGLPSWLAGATTLEGAQANCALPPLTGGKVTVTQFLMNGLDHHYACP